MALFFIILFSFIYLNLRLEKSLYIHKLSNNTSILNTDRHIYYTLHPGGGIKDQISLYYDDLNFGNDESIDQLVYDMPTVLNVYPYVALDFSENGITLEVEDNTFTINASDSRFLILPYYKEDNLDEKMEKVFMNVSLIKKCNELGIDVSGKELLIKNVRIPVSSHPTEVFGSRNNQTATTYYPNQTDYVYKDLKFDIDNKSVDSFSTVYNTSNIVYIPYNKLLNILEENKNNNADPYEIYARIAFSDEDVSDEIMRIDSQISSLKDCTITPFLDTVNSKTLYWYAVIVVLLIGAHLFIEIRPKINTFIYSGELLVGILAINYVFTKNITLTFSILSIIECFLINLILLMKCKQQD